MPKRTNDFQKIVFLIQKLLGDRACVQESVLLEDRETQSNVEVDILITGKVGNTEIKIGVECVDRSRPINIEWIRSMLKKHEDLPIDKSIFVSKSGFTSQAIKKANSNGAEALTLDEVKDYDWIGEFKDKENLEIASYQLSLLSGKVNFQESVPAEILELIETKTIVFNKSFPNGLSMDQYGTSIIRRKDVFEDSIRLYLETKKENRGNSLEFNLNITPNEDTYLEIEGTRYLIESIIFRVKSEVTDKTPIKFRLAKFDDHTIAYSSFKNIFQESINKSRNAIFTVLVKNKERKGLLSIPDYEGNGDLEFSMNFPQIKDET